MTTTVVFTDDQIIYPKTASILKTAEALNLKTTYISYNLDENEAKTPFMKNWPERPIDYKDKAWFHKNVAIITGIRSGLVCIDIDNKIDTNNINGLCAFESMVKTHTEFDTLEKYIDSIKKYTLVEKTPSGGYHIYYGYDDMKHRQLLPQFKNHSTIDVKANGGCSIMAGSVYLSCATKTGIHKCGAKAGEECKYKFKQYEFVGDYSKGYEIEQHYKDADPVEFENRTHWLYPLPMPEWIYNECKVEIPKFSLTCNQYNEYDDIVKQDEELLDWVLPLVNRSCGHYWEWFSIVVAIKKTGGSLEVAKQYSMLCPEKYDEEDLEKKWDKIDFNEYTVCPNFGSIKSALKKQDFDKFKEVDKKYNKKYKPLYNDKYGAKVLVNLAGKDNFIKLVNKIDGSVVLYVFDNERGQWIQNNEKNLALRTLIHKFEIEMRQYEIYEDKDGNEKVKIHDYSGQSKSLNNLCGFVPDIVKEINEMEFRKMNLETKEKLLFKNGIYNMKTGEFSKKFDNTLFFLHRINRSFRPEVNKEDWFKDLKSRINRICFQDAFDYQVDDGFDTNGNKKVKDYRDSGRYFRTGLSFGLAGRTDAKLCFMNIGGTDCGKSITTIALGSACDEYFGTFDANNFIVQKNEDEAKALKWLYDTIGKRILISNEMKRGAENMRIQFDVELLKKVVGGGDTLRIRKLGKNEIEIVNQSMFVYMLNDLPDFNNPEDEAFKGRNTILEYKLQFVNKTQAEIDELKLTGVKPKDTTIGDMFIKNDDWKDALLYLILDDYKLYHSKELKSIAPQTVIESGEEWINKGQETKASLRDILEEKGIIITNDDTDFVPIEDLSCRLSDRLGSITKILLGKKIKALITCAQKGYGTVNGKQKKGVSGLKMDRL
jgi:hypothetical protein